MSFSVPSYIDGPESLEDIIEVPGFPRASTKVDTPGYAASLQVRYSFFVDEEGTLRDTRAASWGIVPASHSWLWVPHVEYEHAHCNAYLRYQRARYWCSVVDESTGTTVVFTCSKL